MSAYKLPTYSDAPIPLLVVGAKKEPTTAIGLGEYMSRVEIKEINHVSSVPFDGADATWPGSILFLTNLLHSNVGTHPLPPLIKLWFSELRPYFLCSRQDYVD